MSKHFLLSDDYQAFIGQIKQSVQQARNRAIRSVNNELIGLYYEIGKQIVRKQAEANWGNVTKMPQLVAQNFYGFVDKDEK
jgi:hypothetical protein